jgi:hypothetical protein
MPADIGGLADPASGATAVATVYGDHQLQGAEAESLYD